MYNKNNSKYKLYLAGVITEGQYYEILEKIENKMLLIENVGYAYVGDKGVLIPSINPVGIPTSLISSVAPNKASNRSF